MRIAALAYGVIITLVVSVAAWQGALQGDDNGPSDDDGWRRTAAGWERIELWAVPKKDDFRGPNRFYQVRPPDGQRWDIHPGLLAAGQLLAVACAFFMGRVVGGRALKKDARNGVGNSLNASQAARRSA